MAIEASIAAAKAQRGLHKPVMILLNTVKGKGVAYAEKLGFASHSFAIDRQLCNEILEELR